MKTIRRTHFLASDRLSPRPLESAVAVPRVALLLSVLFLLLSASPLWSEGSPAEREAFVKSSYLINFARYIEWPESVFESATSPVKICVFGSDPMWKALKEVSKGKTSQDREVQAREVFEVETALGCHVVFVSVGEKEAGTGRGKRSGKVGAERLESSILKELLGQPVLTVGESIDFLKIGGGIRFALADNRVIFEVNLDSTDLAGLTLSSRMLSVAREVSGREGSDEESLPSEEKANANDS